MSCDVPPQSEEALMPRRRKIDKTGVCIKCKTSAGNIVVRHAVYCKECFLVLVTSKFRHVLDPTINVPNTRSLTRGALKASGNLMIGYSGGLGSTILLDLIRRCYFSQEQVEKGGKKHPRKSGRVWEKVIICYVECCEGRQNARDRTEDVKAAQEEFQDIAEIIVIRLEDAFKNIGPELRSIGIDLSREAIPFLTAQRSDVPPATLLKSYLGALPTVTSQQSAISSLTRILLQYAARAHGCSHLLLGISLTSLSVNLIKSVATGGGFSIGMEKGEDWRSDDGEVVRVVLPLREISMKECAAYTRWRNLRVIGNERMLTETTSVRESIGDITKEFIFGLERDYPSTVSAIVRTCGKLVSNTGGSKCVLCERPAQPGVQEWKERISIRSIEDGGTNSMGNDLPSEDSDTLAPLLCYGCHTMLISRSSRSAPKLASSESDGEGVRLPEWVGKNVATNTPLTRPELKSHIQDHLLDEDDDGDGT